VLNLAEAPQHPHNEARASFVDFEGVTQPAPAPRFSRSQSGIQSSAAIAGEHSEEILKDWGFDDHTIAELARENAI